MRSCRREGQPPPLGEAPLLAPAVARQGPPSPGNGTVRALGISQTAIMLYRCDSPPEPPKNITLKLPLRSPGTQPARWALTISPRVQHHPLLFHP